MSSFVSLDIETDSDALIAECFDQMETAFPGWEAAEGSPEVWLIRILSAVIGAPLAEVAADMPVEAFRSFGETVHGVTPLAAASATGTVTITAVDNAGYTIPAGTQLAIPTAGDTSIGFQVLTEAVIPAASTSVAGVTIAAILPGTEANGLTADPELIDSLAYVTSVEQTSTSTSGGVDAETADEYLDRLVDTLGLLSQNIVLPSDAEVLARSIPGVERATALDGYDADNDTTGNEKMLSVAVVDEDGAALSTPVKEAVEDLLAAHREVQFVFFVIDPTFNDIDVTTTVVARPGFDQAGVEAAVEQAISDYLSPANWGIPGVNEESDYPGGWRNRTVLRRNDLIALVDNVDSVDYVSTLTLAFDGDALGTADLTLDGPAPLTNPDTISCTAS